ncbi:anti-sigma factor antagonist [Streptomyces sp. NPDC021012]|uniref:caspase, EACC1-associated type n=1 Tax=Streptomyces sp. NPDC021012 TaxID=3365107 RepID=UPI00378EC1A3
MRLPDPARSRAVLIGVSTYRDKRLPDQLQVRSNVFDLHGALTDLDYGIISPEHCSTFLNPTDQAYVGAGLNEAAEGAQDLLLFYYSGHGLIATRRHELFLSLANTEWDSIPSSAIPFELVRDVFLTSHAKNRVVVLDCCFSGRAIGETLSSPSDDIVAIHQVPVSGAYTITATSGNAVAKSETGHRNTVFTGSLLSVMNYGIPEEQSLLSFGRVYRELTRLAKEQGQPAPQSSGTDTAAETLALVPNRAHERYRTRNSELNLSEIPAEYFTKADKSSFGPGSPTYSCDIRVREENGWVVTSIAGELDVYSAPWVRAEFVHLVRRRPDGVVLDLSMTDFIDSTGFGVIAGMLKRCRAHNISLRLAINTERITKQFRVMGLTKVFPIYGSVAEACFRAKLPEHLEGSIPVRSPRERIPIQAYTTQDLRAVARWIASDNKERSHDDMLREMIRVLGFSRAGPRIRSSLEQAIADEHVAAA